MKFYLKPQWALREVGEDGNVAVTSENMHYPLDGKYAAILKQLVHGVDALDLDDAEFDLVEQLNERGFLTTQLDPAAPAWELSGYNFHSVQEQLKHTKFSVVDKTHNGVGNDLRDSLIEAGATESDTPNLIIMVVNSYLDLEDQKGKNVLPIVANRMRVTIGPMIFPWGQHVGEQVAKSEHYMPQPGYELPKQFDALQRAWINASVMQFLGGMQLRYVRNFVEYNMGKQELKLWPLR